MISDIVIVDDDELTIELVCRRLRHTPLRIRCFNSGERALQHLRGHSSRVLLLDHRMPGLSGIETLREFVRFDPPCATATYLCSAAELPASISEEAQSLGASILSKDVYRDAPRLLRIFSAHQEINGQDTRKYGTSM